MDTDSHFPQPPPPPGPGRPPFGRIPSWQRPSPVSIEGGPPPPVPPPPHIGGSVPASSSPRSSRSSFVLDGGPSEPISGMSQPTPEMWDAMRKFTEAGGYEGMKRQIVEEVSEQLKSGESDGESMGSAPSPPLPPTAYPGRPPVPRFATQIPPQPPGPPLPHTPPASPHQIPQACPPASKRFSTSGPPPPLARPRQSGREADVNAVDKSWGELFDADGKATNRLRQVLKGVANYLISQASPRESVVITPSKLSAFYKQFSVDNEPHPYPRIFECLEDNKEDYRDIKYLYNDLECEYHLVKSRPTSSKGPIVPALTPAGFVKWITISIYAYPDEEAQRLHAIMSGLPMEAECDGKRERLPRQLSRHLLPPRPDKITRRAFNKAVKEVPYQRSVREEDAERTSYGSGGVRSRPMNRRSESEPIAQKEYRCPSRDGEDEAPKKHVSFGRSKAPDANGTPQPRRPSGDRAGRPHSVYNGKISTPASSERHDDPVSPTSGSPNFELNSGRDRSREGDRDRDRLRDRDRDRERRYSHSQSSTPRRMSGEEVRSESRKRKGRRHDVVVKQDKTPSWVKAVHKVFPELEDAFDV